MATAESTPSLFPSLLKTCKRCGNDKPETDFRIKRTPTNPLHRHTRCKECEAIEKEEAAPRHRESAKKSTYAWRAKNQERHQENKRRWNREHPENIRRYGQRRYAQHHEEILAKNRKRRQQSLEQYRMRARELRKRPEQQAKAKAWWDAHPEKKLIYNRRNALKNGQVHTAIRRARKHALPASFTKCHRIFCFQYWHFTCAYCGEERSFDRTIALDHFFPIADPTSPGTVPWNMLPACHGKGSCNTSKQHRNPYDWVKHHFGTRKANAILQRIETYFQIVRTR
jgi:hypothetical protein